LIAPRARNQRGQSSVEFALIFPLLLVVLLFMVQVALVAYAQLGVTHIARETARTLAVDPSVDVDLLRSTNGILSPNNLSLSATFSPSALSNREMVLVEVTCDISPITPLFATFFGSASVRSEVKMLVEG